jgi:hypothetical protein
VEVYVHAFFDLGTGWKWVASFTPRPLHLHGKSPCYPLDRRLRGPQSRSGRGEDKNSQPRRESNTRTPIVRLLDKTTWKITSSPSWEADSHSSSQEIPRLYWNRSFITVFTAAHHWSPSWARRIQSTTSHPISLRSTVVLSSYLCLGLASGLFPSSFPTRNLYKLLISPMRATCPLSSSIY